MSAHVLWAVLGCQLFVYVADILWASEPLTRRSKFKFAPPPVKRQITGRVGRTVR